MGNSVVYKWLREDGTPYYIGIGKPERPYTGKRSCGPPPPKDRIIVLYEGLDWQTACDIEKNLIAFYGRKDLGTGVLRNLTDGGEGVQGHRHTKESKKKMSERKKGENHPFYGKKRSEETNKKISKGKIGKKKSEEEKKKMSEARRGKKHSEETKKKMSEARKGENNHKYTPRNWYHPVYGEVLQKSISELVEMFPEQRLDGCHLSSVALGKRSHHRRWRPLCCPITP